MGNHFNGEVKGVQLSIADDPNNADHLVKPEDAINAALPALYLNLGIGTATTI